MVKDLRSKIIVVLGLYKNKVSPENVVAKLAEAGYSVTLAHVQEMQAELVHSIRSPWRKTGLPAAIDSQIRRAATSIRKSYRPPRPTDPKLVSLYHELVGDSTYTMRLEKERWRQLQEFIQDPFSPHREVARVVTAWGVITKRGKPDPAIATFVAFVKEKMARDPVFRVQLQEAFKAREKVGRLRVKRALNRSGLRTLTDVYRTRAEPVHVLHSEALKLHGRVFKIRYEIGRIKKRYRPRPGK